ncbi:MAG: hypothetical protein AB1Z98_10245 [Nannocystaceae bacterium]
MSPIDRISSSLLTAALLVPATAYAADEPGAAPPPSSATPTAAPAPAPAEAVASPPAATPAPVPAPAPAATAEPAAPATTTTTTVVTTTSSAPAVEPESVVTPMPATPPAATPVADPYVHVPINIGLFPPLSINGSHRNQKIRNTVSASFGWSRVDRLEGAAVALGATVVDEDARGITWALGANITRGEHRGIQATHGYNHAGSLRGLQVGAINHVGEGRGMQAGLINVGRGRVRGVQVGLINYAEEADASFALIPVTKKGGIRPEVWTSDTAAFQFGVRLPAKYTYAFFAGGVHPFARTRPARLARDDDEPGTTLMAGMGFGGRLPVRDDLSLEADLSGWVVTGGLRAGTPIGSLTKVRAMVSWQLRPRFAVWGGPTLNVLVDGFAGDVARPGYGWVAASQSVDGIRMRWWPGFAAGLRF